MPTTSLRKCPFSQEAKSRTTNPKQGNYYIINVSSQNTLVMRKQETFIGKRLPHNLVDSSSCINVTEGEQLEI